MTDRPTSHPIDFTRIRFPSDRITVANLRRAHPVRFDVEGAVQFEGVQDNDPEFLVPVMMALERMLARNAHSIAAGMGTDVLTKECLERADCIKDLTDCYAAYGVSSGPNQTEELVREIEAQAVAQVVGRPR